MKKTSASPTDIAAQRHVALTRRSFLRGLGACIALPAFESLLPVRSLAALAGASPTAKLASTASGAPLRTVFLYFPNGAIQSTWWPKGEGSAFELSRTLQPLEPLRQHIQVFGGLDHLNATAGPDGAGDHARANGTFLTGVRMKKSATNIRAGISIDQVIAREVGHLTRLPSLELTCDAGRNTGACDSGYSCAYQYNMSWSSPTTPMTPEANPRQVFERLFGAGSRVERAEELKRRRAEQRSILDFVREDARDMQQRLNAADRDKLDQYLTGVRELEARIQRAEQLGDPQNPLLETPTGIPPTYAEHVQSMFDLLLLAFQTDSTRVATMLLAHDGSNRSFAEIGIPEGHHDLSHHRNNQEWIRKLSDIDLWYAKQFARFLERLRATPDTDGKSLLDNAMIVYGSGNADGNAHSHTNLPIVLAGGGGGKLTPGRFIRHGAKPASNLFLSLADRMGVTGMERFGDSTGHLANL
jgi:BMFP domain-containing protein YqiC